MQEIGIAHRTASGRTAVRKYANSQQVLKPSPSQRLLFRKRTGFVLVLLPWLQLLVFLLSPLLLLYYIFFYYLFFFIDAQTLPSVFLRVLPLVTSTMGSEGGRVCLLPIPLSPAPRSAQVLSLRILDNNKSRHILCYVNRQTKRSKRLKTMVSLLPFVPFKLFFVFL